MYVMHFQKVGYPPASYPCVACDLRSKGISEWKIIGDEASIIRRCETPCRVGCRKEKIYNNDKQLQLFRLKYCHIVCERVLCLNSGEFKVIITKEDCWSFRSGVLQDFRSLRKLGDL